MRLTPWGLAILLTASAVGQEALPAKDESEVVITSADGMGEVELDRKTNIATARNGVVVRFKTAVLTAQRVRISADAGTIEAEGDVSIQETRPDGGAVLWRGEQVKYDYINRKIESERFRFGSPPYFVAGESLRAGSTNQVQTATNAFVTTDDVPEPEIRIKARSLTVTDNKTLTATDATAFVGPVPVMYYPKFTESLGERRFSWSASPGYRNTWGAFVLGSYNQNWSESLQTALELDFYSRRGPGIGPTAKYDLGQWGQGQGQVYYINDRLGGTNFFGGPLPENRGRINYSHFANPYQDFYLKGTVRYQSDPNIVHDFFDNEYRSDTQPLTLFEAQQLWKNYTLGVITVPQVNPFQQQVERLPEVTFSGNRQQIGKTPLYYESQNRAGYLEFRGGDYASTNYSAFRGDTFHQVTLPYTAFGWLNVIPRAGGRFTAYSETTGLPLEAQNRWIFNTGAEVTGKASALWQNTKSGFWDLDGLRHVIQPSVNYAYVPTPSVQPFLLPQFDRRTPSLELDPVEFPDNNSIDSLDYRNVIRLSLFNLLQTKRSGNVKPFVALNLYTDWNVGDLQIPNSPITNSRFSDGYSRLMLQPRDWFAYGNLVRYDMVGSQMKVFDNLVQWTPVEAFSWTVGNRYLVGIPALGLLDSSLFYSGMGYRVNENWSLRMSQQFEAKTGTMQAQYYTLSRDFRSWVGALTVRLQDNGVNGLNWTVGVGFQLKAAARGGALDNDFGPNRLMGYWN